MATTLLYLQDTDPLTASAVLEAIDTDDKGTYLVFDQTVFYPQGGGQPCDTGHIEINGHTISIIAVRAFEGIVRHYTPQPTDTLSSVIGHTAAQHVDKARRHLNACYHTAAHLVGHGVETLIPHCLAVKGHAFPDGAYVEFAGVTSIQDSFAPLLESALSAEIAADHLVMAKEVTPEVLKVECLHPPYEVPAGKALRIVQIASQRPIPCGGTHLKHLAPLGRILITKTKFKEGQLKVSYSLEAD